MAFKQPGFNLNTQTELTEFHLNSGLKEVVADYEVAIERLKNWVNYQTDHADLLCEYLVIKTYMLFPQRIVVVKIRCMRLTSFITPTMF